MASGRKISISSGRTRRWRCCSSGVERLIHVSGIGADPASSAPYIASRGKGEIAVQQGFPRAILIRPPVMFGPDDAFLTTVARLREGAHGYIPKRDCSARGPALSEGGEATILLDRYRA